MKPAAQLIVTILLVAGGIFVYDAMVVRPPEEASGPILRTEEAAGASEEPRTEPPSSFAVLEGTGDDIWRAEVDRRLAELEQVRTEAVGDAGAAPEGMPAVPGKEGEEGEEGADEPLDPEVQEQVERQRLKWFREMLEKVERQRRWEQAARKVKQYFDNLDLALTDEQMRDAVRTTVQYQAKWGQMKRKLDAEKAGDQARKDGYANLFNEYHEALGSVIPTSEADLIILALKNAAAKRDQQQPKR